MSDERDQDAPSVPQAGDADAAGADTPRLRLRSLKVHVFRDVRPGTDLRFGDGFHLILGKNATGKSTLLELIAAASTLGFRGSFFAETPFHIEASFEIGKVQLSAEIKRTFQEKQLPIGAAHHIDSPPQEAAELIVRLDLPHVPFRQWVVARTGQGIFLSRTDPKSATTAEMPGLGGTAAVDPLLFGMLFAVALGAQRADMDGIHPEAVPAFDRIVRHLGTGAPFDEALGVLRRMTERDAMTVSMSEGHRAVGQWLPPQLGFEARGEPVTLDLLVAPVLEAVIPLLGFDGARMYFGPGAAVRGGWSYSRPSFQFFRNGKAVRRHDQLSFGQQRLFSFAWYLACNPDIAIADELVNGLHAEWIDWCVEAMGDRQCFLTSQNPLLVDAVPLRTEEDIRSGIILCEADSAAGQLSFRQLAPREYELIGRALGQSRLDLLSDLLHALNLW